MEKSKLGLNIGMLAALTYLACNFAGYTIAMLLVGYILLCEDSTWLKRNALKGVLIMLALSMASTVIHLIPNIVSIPLDLLNLFGFNLYFHVLNELANLLYSIVSLGETLLLLLLALKAVSQEEVKVPVIDKVVDMFYED